MTDPDAVLAQHQDHADTCAATFVLRERERELMETRGPCAQHAENGCRLHRSHSGPCDIRAEWLRSAAAGAASERAEYQPPGGAAYRAGAATAYRTIAAELREKAAALDTRARLTTNNHT